MVIDYCAVALRCRGKSQPTAYACPSCQVLSGLFGSDGSATLPHCFPSLPEYLHAGGAEWVDFCSENDGDNDNDNSQRRWRWRLCAQALTHCHPPTSAQAALGKVARCLTHAQ